MYTPGKEGSSSPLKNIIETVYVIIKTNTTFLNYWERYCQLIQNVAITTKIWSASFAVMGEK